MHLRITIFFWIPFPGINFFSQCLENTQRMNELKCLLIINIPVSFRII